MYVIVINVCYYVLFYSLRRLKNIVVVFVWHTILFTCTCWIIFWKFVGTKLPFFADSSLPIHCYLFLEICWNEIIVFCRFIATHSSLPFFGNLVEQNYRFLADSLLPIHFYPFLEISWKQIIVFGGFFPTHSSLPFFGNLLERNYCFLRIATHSSLPFFGNLVERNYCFSADSSLLIHRYHFFGNLLEQNYRFLRIHCYPFISTIFGI